MVTRGASTVVHHQRRRPARAWSDLAIIAVLQTIVASAATAAGFATPQEDDRRLAHGEVLVDAMPDPDGAAGVIRAAVEIPVPPNVLWSTMTDCAHASQFIRGLESCRILERDPGGAWDIREHVVQAHWLLPRTRTVFRSEYVRDRQIRFALSGGDLKTLEGEWRLDPIDQGRMTRLTYRVRIDPGLAVPDAVVRAIVESDVPRTLTALRGEAMARHAAH